MQDLNGIIHRNLRAVVKAGVTPIKLSKNEASYLGVAPGEYSAAIITDMLDLREGLSNSRRMNQLEDLVENG